MSSKESNKSLKWALPMITYDVVLSFFGGFPRLSNKAVDSGVEKVLATFEPEDAYRMLVVACSVLVLHVI